MVVLSGVPAVVELGHFFEGRVLCNFCDESFFEVFSQLVGVDDLSFVAHLVDVLGHLLEFDVELSQTALVRRVKSGRVIESGGLVSWVTVLVLHAFRSPLVVHQPIWVFNRNLHPKCVLLVFFNSVSSHDAVRDRLGTSRLVLLAELLNCGLAFKVVAILNLNLIVITSSHFLMIVRFVELLSTLAAFAGLINNPLINR